MPSGPIFLLAYQVCTAWEVESTLFVPCRANLISGGMALAPTPCLQVIILCRANLIRTSSFLNLEVFNKEASILYMDDFGRIEERVPIVRDQRTIQYGVETSTINSIPFIMERSPTILASPVTVKPMPVYNSTINLETNGEIHIIDITRDVNKVIQRSNFRNGMVCVFVPGATGALTTIEYESGLLEDLPTALERLYPKGIEYKHHLRWHDGNGHSHIRASMIGPSVTIPFISKKLTLGTWQQIVFIELDNRPRDRELIVQVIGE